MQPVSALLLILGINALTAMKLVMINAGLCSAGCCFRISVSAGWCHGDREMDWRKKINTVVPVSSAFFSVFFIFILKKSLVEQEVLV